MVYFIKRGTALFIDAMILGAICTFAQEYIFTKYPDLPTSLYTILLISLFFKDAIINGTSIGKRIMNLAVYKTSWEKPSFWESLKRTVLITSVGYLVFLKSFFSEEGVLSFFDWERDTLKLIVIEKDLYKNISDKSKSKEHMLALYNEHLLTLYSKE